MVEASPPAIGPDQALVQTVISGISAGTERLWFEGTTTALRSGRRNYPYRPGYALVGHVVAASASFYDAAPGDRVFAMKPHGSHAVLGGDDLWCRLPFGLSDDDALGIALTATSLHAIERAGLAPGDAATVAGIGMLGAILVQTLRATIGGAVIALSRDPEKRVRGASEVRAYGEVATPVRALFECSGDAGNVARLVALAGAGSKIVLVGSYTEPLALDAESIFAKELTLSGTRSIGDGADRRRNFERAVALVAEHKIRVADLVTHRFDAERFAEAYHVVRERNAGTGQIVLDWREPGFR